MKFLIVLFALIVAAFAAPQFGKFKEILWSGAQNLMKILWLINENVKCVWLIKWIILMKQEEDSVVILMVEAMEEAMEAMEAMDMEDMEDSAAVLASVEAHQMVNLQNFHLIVFDF